MHGARKYGKKGSLASKKKATDTMLMTDVNHGKDLLLSLLLFTTTTIIIYQ